jgi:hypothetical protein
VNYDFEDQIPWDPQALKAWQPCLQFCIMIPMDMYGKHKIIVAFPAPTRANLSSVPMCANCWKTPPVACFDSHSCRMIMRILGQSAPELHPLTVKEMLLKAAGCGSKLAIAISGWLEII